jgi:hypothetical protein
MLYSHFYLGGFFSNFSKKADIKNPTEYPFVNIVHVKILVKHIVATQAVMCPPERTEILLRNVPSAIMGSRSVII